VTRPANFAMLAPVRGGLSLRPGHTALFRLALVCALAAGLAGCGRKGPLDLPPADSAAATQQQQQQSATGPANPLGATTQPPAAQNPGAPNRPFLLDPLLN
jgi:predicted small lipoprotein YifL